LIFDSSINMAKPNPNPKSTIVLITGANQGIGFEIAKKLAREHPDYHVLLGSRNPSRGLEAASKLQAENLSVEAITIDVCSDSSIATAAKLVEEKFGKLDVLINNAGIGLDDKHQSGEKKPQRCDVGDL